METKKTKKVNSTKVTSSKSKNVGIEKEKTTKKKSSVAKKSASRKTSTVNPEKSSVKKSRSKKEEVLNKPLNNNTQILKEETSKNKEVKENGINKRIIFKILLVIVAMLILIIGATYAYFAVSTTEDSNTTRISIDSVTLGTIALTNPTSNLHIRLDAVSMSTTSGGNIYYATTDANADYETTRTPRTVAKATLTGGDAGIMYRCTFNLNVDLTGTMVDLLQAGDASIIFSGAYEGEYDLATVADTRVVTFENISSTNNEKDVKVVVKFNNKNTSQDYLVDTSMNIVISNSDFNCKTSNTQG